MDPFTYIVVGFLVAMVVVLLLLGAFHPKSGAEVLGWKPTRSPELEAQNEIDDIEQMVAAQNALRRRHGKADRSEEDIELEVMRHQQELREYSARYWEDQEKLKDE